MPGIVTRLNLLMLAAGCGLFVWQCRLSLGLSAYFFGSVPIW